jgi:hypothetical protein
MRMGGAYLFSVRISKEFEYSFNSKVALQSRQPHKNCIRVVFHRLAETKSKREFYGEVFASFAHFILDTSTACAKGIGF